MGKITGFLETARAELQTAPPPERVKHYGEFVLRPSSAIVGEQAARCMDCGIPFCQSGCPIHNCIPDWNDLVHNQNWRRALDVLHSTNNFPEFTGRVCPAPCEAACTLNINDDPVTIKSVECAIIDRGWKEGWVMPQLPAHKTGKRIAVVGSGPAGLACAQQLARAGHGVEVYEKNERSGGLLRFGIPDFKMEKLPIDRRIEQMTAEGVVFHNGVCIGAAGGMPAGQLHNDYDAVVLAGGCEMPRDLPVAGRQLRGVHFAMEFLPQQNRRVAGLDVKTPDILAAGKNVIVIGGGDTGSDCIGTSNRQDALAVRQLELMPQPPECENKDMVWPDWPLKMRTSSSHEEGCGREWSITTKELIDDGDGNVCALRAARVEWQGGKMTEMPDSAFDIPADLVLLAMGYVSPVRAGMLEELALTLDARGNVQTENYRSSMDNVFCAGDMRRGQSLVVWAIREGRQCARAVDAYLNGKSHLAG
ncbi:MAG: glutamate synthase subunit beta [Gammaproteobacteria bacterium]